MRRSTRTLLLTSALSLAMSACTRTSPVNAPQGQSQELPDRPVARPLSATNLAFSPDGRLVLTAGYEWGIHLFDLASGRELRSFKGHEEDYQKVAFSPDGRRALSYGYSEYIFLWDVESGQEIRRMPGGTDGTARAIFTPDGLRVLTVSEGDSVIRLLDASSGEELRRIKMQEKDEYLYSDISTSGARALSQTHGNKLCLWDVERGTKIRCFKSGASTSFFQLFGRHAVLRDEKTGALSLLDVEGDGQVRRLGSLKSDAVYDLSADATLAIAGHRKEIDVLDLGSGREIARLETDGTEENLVFALTPDGRNVIGGCTNDSLCVWDAQSGQRLRYLKLESK
jgi:WD40 repeat protein